MLEWTAHIWSSRPYTRGKAEEGIQRGHQAGGVATIVQAVCRVLNVGGCGNTVRNKLTDLSKTPSEELHAGNQRPSV